MNLTRRSALLSASALIPAALLVGCNGTTLSQLAQDAQAVVNAAQAVDNALIADKAPIPSSVAGYLSVIGASATAIENATSGSTGTFASQLVAAGEAVLPILAAIPGIGTTALLGLSALQVLISTISSEAGLTSVSAAPMSAAQAAAMANIVPMDITTARRLYAPSIAH